MEREPTFEEIRAALRNAVESARKAEAEARERAQKAEIALVLLESMFQVTSRPAHQGSNGEVLLGIEAVRRIVKAQPERVWRAKEIHDALVEHGWVSDDAKHPKAATEAAINRLWKRDELERVDAGRYRWRADQGRFVEN